MFMESQFKARIAWTLWNKAKRPMTGQKHKITRCDQQSWQDGFNVCLQIIRKGRIYRGIAELWWKLSLFYFSDSITLNMCCNTADTGDRTHAAT